MTGKFGIRSSELWESLRWQFKSRPPREFVVVYVHDNLSKSNNETAVSTDTAANKLYLCFPQLYVKVWKLISLPFPFPLPLSRE